MSPRPLTRTEARQKAYKTTVDADEGRRRREDDLVEIRKNKRDENLLKKRREGLHHSPDASSEAREKLESLTEIAQGVWSDNLAIQLEATTKFRKLLEIVPCPHIDQVIETGVIPKFVDFLSRYDQPMLQFEAAWALTTVASGPSRQIQPVIEHGAVPLLVQLLRSPNDNVREQAVWALGNIARGSISCRDLVLSHGALMPLLAQFNGQSRISMLRIATWTLSILCGRKPLPPFEQTKPALQILQLLINLDDEQVLANVCWTLFSLSHGNNERIQSVLEIGVCKRLLELLSHPSTKVLMPALLTISNIATGDDAQTQCVIDDGAFQALQQFLTGSQGILIANRACRLVSNITAGNRVQIQAVIDAQLFDPILNLPQNAMFDTKKVAAWAISNATSGGSFEQIKYLVRKGCIKPLCDLLTCSDPQTLYICLRSLQDILEVGEAEKNETGGLNVYTFSIEMFEGVNKIEDLQRFENSDICTIAIEILQRYWEV